MILESGGLPAYQPGLGKPMVSLAPTGRRISRYKKQNTHWPRKLMGATCLRTIKAFSAPLLGRGKVFLPDPTPLYV